ncbi:MAG: hypothetical protein L0H59_12370, partial [Tomitella sp.]|nr:hypothetical protein [Tomitella sp.]
MIILHDAHLADQPSLDDLGVLWRRMATADIAVVVTHQHPSPTRMHPWLGAVAQHPRTRHVRLTPLSVPEIETLLAPRIGGPDARATATSAFVVTGGNQVLTTALAADQPVRSPGSRGSSELVVGDEFTRRVVTCLERVEPPPRAVAGAVAALHRTEGEPGAGGTVSVIARALDTGVEEVELRLAELESAGLVVGGRYRSDIATGAVVSGMPLPERGELFGRVAAIVHFEGVGHDTVARLLDAAAVVPVEWGVDVLWAAALDDLRRDHVEVALHRLRAAAESTQDPARAAAINFLRLRAEWRTNPVAAVELLDLSVRAATGGFLDGAEVHQFFCYLAWYGCVDRLRSLSESMAGPAAARAGDTVSSGCSCRRRSSSRRASRPRAGTRAPGGRTGRPRNCRAPTRARAASGSPCRSGGSTPCPGRCAVPCFFG